MCCSTNADEINQQIDQNFNSDDSNDLVEVSPVVISNNVIYQTKNHTPLLQPAPILPQNGPVIIDSKMSPIPGEIPVESGDFPSVTPVSRSVEFPSVTPISGP